MVDFAPVYDPSGEVQPAACCGMCGAVQYLKDDEVYQNPDNEVDYCIIRDMYVFAEDKGCGLGWDEDFGVLTHKLFDV